MAPAGGRYIADWICSENLRPALSQSRLDFTRSLPVHREGSVRRAPRNPHRYSLTAKWELARICGEFPAKRCVILGFSASGFGEGSHVTVEQATCCGRASGYRRPRNPEPRLQFRQRRRPDWGHPHRKIQLWPGKPDCVHSGRRRRRIDQDRTELSGVHDKLRPETLDRGYLLRRWNGPGEAANSAAAAADSAGWR